MDIAEKLITLAPKINKILLVAPMAGLSKILPHVTVIPGVRGKYVGGMLSADTEFRPYKTEKGETDGAIAIIALERENFLGDVVVEYDPNAILSSIYGESISKNMTDLQIVQKVAVILAQKAGEKLYINLFKAKRNAAGTKTIDLFNGFETIVLDQITAGNVSVVKENLMDKSTVQMTVANCGDILKEFVRSADENLTDRPLKLFMPKSVRQMYEDWYQVEYGVVPWNSGISQRTLVGFENVELVDLSNLKDASMMYLTVKENVQILVDQQSDTETSKIRQCDNPKVVQFFMMAWFGCGIETVQKEFFKALKFTTNPV